MTFTTKALAAAVAFAASTSAFAAPTFQTTQSGNSSLVFAAWDDVRQVSFVQDLGVNIADFLPTSGLTDTLFDLDSLFDTTFAGSDVSNIKWHVAAGDRSGAQRFAVTQAGAGPNPFGTTAGGTLGASIDAVLNNANLGNGFAASDTNSYSTDSATSASRANGARLLTGSTTQGSSAGSIGQTLNFIFFTPTSITGGTKTSYDRGFTLSGNGDLCYGDCTPANPVPVPAAVWLLGSALAGVAGVARRRA